MRRIVVKEARPGMLAARNVAAPDGTMLLESNDIMTTRHLVALHSAGIYDLWISDPGFDFFDELCANQPTVAQQRLADGLRKSFLGLSFFIDAAQMKRFALPIEDLVRGIVKTAPVVPCFQALTEDEALLGHSCDVTALAALLGFKLESYLVEQRRRLNGKQAREILNLAMGALFHDVGELMLPAGQRESRLTNASADVEHWKIHVDEGYGMVRGRLDPSAAVIVLQHHQRFDGSGFASQSGVSGPCGGDSLRKVQSGQDIHIYARIVMAADLFCQTHYGAVGSIAQPMVKTLWQLQQVPMRRAIDPVVYDCLLATFPAFAEGMIVSLSNQCQAVVRKIEAAYPCYPVVQTLRGSHRVTKEDGEPQTSEVLDLAIKSDVTIETVDAFPVRKFLYGVRKGRPSQAA